MPTLTEIEHELQVAAEIPTAARGEGWHAMVNALLAQRALLAGTEAQRRETRVVKAAETR